MIRNYSKFCDRLFSILFNIFIFLFISFSSILLLCAAFDEIFKLGWGYNWIDFWVGLIMICLGVILILFRKIVNFIVDKLK